MPPQLANVKNDALLLSVGERAELAKDLLVSLDGAAEADIEKAWDIEICRRINDVESGEAKLIDADEVLAKVKRRLKRI